MEGGVDQVYGERFLTRLDLAEDFSAGALKGLVRLQVFGAGF